MDEALYKTIGCFLGPMMDCGSESGYTNKVIEHYPFYGQKPLLMRNAKMQDI